MYFIYLTKGTLCVSFNKKSFNISIGGLLVINNIPFVICKTELITEFILIEVNIS